MAERSSPLLFKERADRSPAVVVDSLKQKIDEQDGPACTDAFDLAGDQFGIT